MVKNIIRSALPLLAVLLLVMLVLQACATASAEPGETAVQEAAGQGAVNQRKDEQSTVGKAEHGVESGQAADESATQNSAQHDAESSVEPVEPKEDPDSAGSGEVSSSGPAPAAGESPAPAEKKDANPEPVPSSSSSDSNEASAGETAPPQSAAPSTVSITIAGEGDIGVILEETEVEWKDGDTVLDVLKRITRERKIQMEYRGMGAFAYVEGIANYYEFDSGPASGWIFRVNGELIKKSAGSWKTEAGDRIEWIYVLKEESE